MIDGIPDEVPCLTCLHRRQPHIPEPSCISDPTNRQRLHWREEWRKLREQRRMKEDEIATRGEPLTRSFAGEPWFYAWCQHKSRQASKAQNDDEVEIYVLADQNQFSEDGIIECADHQRRPQA
jgi:hypothetical protein